MTEQQSKPFYIVGKHVTVSSDPVAIWKAWQQREEGWTLREMTVENGVVYCDYLNHADDDVSSELFYKGAVVPAQKSANNAHPVDSSVTK